MELVGTQPLGPIYEKKRTNKKPAMLQTLPSDHYGVLTVFQPLP